jgi:hypothetical protein
MAIPTKFVNDRHKIDYILMQLDNESPKWAVPEMQRKFVWKDAQIIKLLSSMFVGFPVGSILYWEDAAVQSHAIGTSAKNSPDKRFDLIIDGQQRMTSLKVIFEGLPIPRRKNKLSTIRIQFNPLAPLDQDVIRFEMISKKGAPKPGWVEVLDVLTTIDTNGKRTRRTNAYGIVSQYHKQNPGLTAEQQDLAGTNISRLNDLYSFEIPAVRLLANTTHSEAAEIFVRINSSGTKLDMADFIMTTLALNNQNIKDTIHRFAEEVPESNIFELEPIDALTALVAYTFALPAGATAYELLKGKNADGKYEEAVKLANLRKLEDNLSIVCKPSNWSEFLDAVSAAGICSKKYLSSDAALLSSYALYLYLLTKKDLSKELKQNAVSLWLLFCTLTKRYTSHTDNQTKRDLEGFINLESADDMIRRIYKIIDEKLAHESSYGIYCKDCENILTICCAQQNTDTLFSKVTNIRQAIEKGQKLNKLEEHHIFPKNHMVSVFMKRKPSLTKEEAEDQVDERVDVIYNLAPIASSENSKISDFAPVDYVANGTAKHQPIKAGFSEIEWDKMCEHYALPPIWWTMEFEEFIEKRSALLPKRIKHSFDSLRTHKPAP